MSDYLPFDIQIEIIKKLPINSLIQFRSVSKAWKCLIDSSNFIAHYTGEAQHVLLIRYENQASEEIYVCIVDDDTFPQKKFIPTVPTSIKLLKDSIVVGTSHGLVCVLGYYHGNPGESKREMAVLWNPSIRKSVAIDTPHVASAFGNVLGFGVCPETSDPKIVKIGLVPNSNIMHNKAVTWNNSHWHVEVFTLSSGVWRSPIGNLPRKYAVFRFPYSQVIVGGAIYWFGVTATTDDPTFQLLISFDLSTEEFKEIHLPVKVAFHDPRELFLCKHKDSLALLKGSLMMGKFEVWIMQQQQDNGSKLFTNLFTVNDLDAAILLTALPLEFRRNRDEIIIAIEIGETSADTVVLAVFRHISKRIEELGIHGRKVFVSSYTESLTLLDQ